MALLYFICSFLQPVCLPVPEMQTVLWGSKILGEKKAFILGVAGSLMGILFMYFFVKRCFAYFERKKKLKQKIQKFQFYIRDYCFIIIGVLFIVPVLPDEIICIGAVFTGLNISRFMCVAFFAKMTGIGMVVYSEQIAKICSMSQIEIMLIEMSVLLITAQIFKMMNRYGGNDN